MILEKEKIIRNGIAVVFESNGFFGYPFLFKIYFTFCQKKATVYPDSGGTDI